MTFRFARHTNNLEKIEQFYTSILGLELIGSFKDHNNYDGIFLGKPNLNWHLEFTKSKETTQFNFGEEDYLVFYPETILEYNNIITSLNSNQIDNISSKNPYWNTNGKIFLDPDGYQIIISKIKAI
jgi:catechol 2,3-dioxygenase-like lactoylglutathione lyase family enzyme